MESQWVTCPTCSRRLGRLIRHRKVFETKCPRCGAVVEITINVTVKEAGRAVTVQPPVRRRRRHSRKPRLENGGEERG